MEQGHELEASGAECLLFSFIYVYVVCVEAFVYLFGNIFTKCIREQSR